MDYFQAKLNDPELLRTAEGGLMPVVWWGNIAQLFDGSLVAGVYPTHYIDNKGNISKGNVSFYRSLNLGRHGIMLEESPLLLMVLQIKEVLIMPMKSLLLKC